MAVGMELPRHESRGVKDSIVELEEIVYILHFGDFSAFEREMSGCRERRGIAGRSTLFLVFV
jgi:hypothetical protein